MSEQERLEAIDPVLLRQTEPNVSEATSPLWVYVAGPMRGIADFNFPAFEEATAQLRSRGYKVISPAEQDLGRGFDPTGLTGHEDMAAIGFDLREALLSDLKFVSECDAICLLPGWEFSKGASAELALAEALGLPNGSLEDYLHTNPMTEREYLTGVADKLWPPKQILADDVLRKSVEALAWVDQVTGGKYRPSCGNCDDRKCMSCVFRDIHDECRDDCPDCCNVQLDRPILSASSERDNEVRITSSTGGQKGKKLARYDLIPVHPLWDVAELYGRGALKYEDRGWERGYAWSLSYAALMRHLQQFWDRESLDKETGSPHLAAVVFHALALLEFSATHPEFDDRPKGSK